MPIFRDDSAAWPIRASSTWVNWETDSIAGHDSRCLQLAAAAVRLASRTSLGFLSLSLGLRCERHGVKAKSTKSSIQLNPTQFAIHFWLGVRRSS